LVSEIKETTMKIPPHFLTSVLWIAIAGVCFAFPQSSTGTISGTITDQNNAVIAGATVTVRNTATEFSRTTATNSEGRYRFPNIPTGSYTVSVDASHFPRYSRSGITLDTGQEAIVDVFLRIGDISAAVEVDEKNASILNTTTTEVSTRFDHRRLSELPLAPNRSVYNAVLSASGISPRGTGQTAFAVGISFVANGGRIRSNNFQLDGQDVNDPALGGSQIALNNPDAIQEVRIITSQFLPEHGHNAASVVDIVSRAGTNDVHGSVFWFHNNENLNACSNTDKQAGFCDRTAQDSAKSSAPYRRENQFGFTIGGPVFFPRFGEGGPYFYEGRDRTFFFADYQRWSDRRTPSLTLRGAPTAEGRMRLQQHAGERVLVQKLLQFVPAGIPNGEFRTVSVNGSAFDVPLGDLTSSADLEFDSDQGSIRLDHIPDQKNLLYARYRYNYETTRRAAQITPPGHGTMIDLSAHAAVMAWTSTLSPTLSNEARMGWKRYRLGRDAEEPSAYSIPAIEITDLGMNGGPEAENRTAFGLPTNLPVYRTSDTFQIVDAISFSKGNHGFKFGAEVRLTDEKSTLFSLERGSLVYATLNNFVNDVAQSASRGLPLPGSDATQFYRWHEAYFYAQDQWRIRPHLTLLYGVRYEYPGDSFQYLRKVNDRILAANNNDPEYRFEPYPKADTNNWMPRVGFNWNPITNNKGIVGFITGGDKLVIRGGYARTYDAWIVNINQNIFTSFPFTASRSFTGQNAFANLMNSTTAPTPSEVQRLTRVIPASDFRSPATDQFSLDVQRELFTNYVLKIGYVRTRGTGLFQTVQGNPRTLCPFGPACNATGIDLVSGRGPAAVTTSPRVIGNRGIISIRANSASSTYDALQATLEKRLSRGFSFGLHYTWSSLIDTASDIFSPSVAEAGTSQNPYDWNADRGRGSYDRPHRLTGNFVYELPFFSKQNGVVGKLLGGWQVNSFFNFQSGPPFSVSLGSDPTGAGNPIRPNLFTSHHLSGMTVPEIYHLELQLRAQAIAQAQQIFLSSPNGLCGWLPGPPLPVTLFSAPRGRVPCRGRRELQVEFFGILEGQSFGNAGRNILRSDGFRQVDIGVIKDTRLGENVRAQFWVDFFNAFNERNFGIPSGVVTAPDFLDQWATDGGSRRLRFGARLVF
jgi:hypothetical protein